MDAQDWLMFLVLHRGLWAINRREEEMESVHSPPHAPQVSWHRSPTLSTALLLCSTEHNNNKSEVFCPSMLRACSLCSSNYSYSVVRGVNFGKPVCPRLGMAWEFPSVDLLQMIGRHIQLQWGQTHSCRITLSHFLLQPVIPNLHHWSLTEGWSHIADNVGLCPRLWPKLQWCKVSN